ncbi:MAG: hypothetical protein ABMB14_01655 [Myxococcota bacterium]
MVTVGWLMAMASNSYAGTCTPAALGEQTVSLQGVTGLVVDGVDAKLEVVGADGSDLRATGAACGDGAAIKLARRGTVVYASVKGKGLDEVSLTLTVPKALPALTVHGHTGPVVVRGVAAPVAVVSSDGPVELSDVKSVRIAYGTGPVVIERVSAGVVVDHLTGSLQAKAIGSDVIADAVTGEVVVDDVAGDLAVRETTGSVRQTNVRGQVALP